MIDTEIEIVAKIPEKPGGPWVSKFRFFAGATDIEEAAKKIIIDCRVVEEGTVIDALLDLCTKRIKERGLPDPDRHIYFMLGFEEFYSALEKEFMHQKTEKGKMKDKIFEIGFTYRGGLLDETKIEDGLETIDIKVDDGHVEAIKNGGPSVIKTWLRGECKFFLHRKYKNLDWCQIRFEDSPDEFMYEITRRAFEAKGGSTDSLESLETNAFDHLFKPVTFRIEKPVLFGVSARYTIGESEHLIDRVFLLPPGLSEQAMRKFCCSEIRREIRFIHGSNGFVNKFEGEIIE